MATEMATAEDLKDVLKDALKKSGALSEIKARIRGELFNAMHNDSQVPPSLSNENLIINELIKEYLSFNGYRYTESVLIAESGQPEMDNKFIKQQLNVNLIRGAKNVPLLYGLVSYLSHKKSPPVMELSSSSKPEVQ